MASVERVRSLILRNLPDSQVYIKDPRKDGSHLHAIVVNPGFKGLSLIKQHQSVMNALKEEFRADLHALQLETFTPEDWEKSKSQFGI